jgi:hypothetical protein
MDPQFSQFEVGTKQTLLQPIQPAILADDARGGDGVNSGTSNSRESKNSALVTNAARLRSHGHRPDLSETAEPRLTNQTAHARFRSGHVRE